jgi:hypothetical protein
MWHWLFASAKRVWHWLSASAKRVIASQSITRIRRDVQISDGMDMPGSKWWLEGLLRMERWYALRTGGAPVAHALRSGTRFTHWRRASATLHAYSSAGSAAIGFAEKNLAEPNVIRCDLH